MASSRGKGTTNIRNPYATSTAGRGSSRNKGKTIKPSTREEDDDETLSEELRYLLPKLRPFQREAYDFATKGIVSKRILQQGRRKGEDNDTTKEESSSFSFDRSYLGKGRILLADEMGLGKTVTSLAIMAHYREEWPLLILCPASLRYTWPGEIEKFLPTIPPSSIHVLNGFNDVDFISNNNGKRNNIQIVVATYSLLQTRSAVAQLLTSKKIQFKCIIADESHNLKCKKSQRSKIALPILQSAKRLLLLSGTPALAKPVELWLPLYALAPDLFGKYTDYTKRYCNARFKFGRMDVTGLSNAKELHSKLRQIMIRRLKCDVLHELPSKQRMIIPVTLTDKAKIKENQQLLKQLKETRLSIGDLVGGNSDDYYDQQRTAVFEAKALFQQAYQASGIAKAQAVADYLVDWIAGAGGNQKVLVFAHHKNVMDTLELAIAKQLKGIGHIRIDGSVPANERANLVRKFQTNAQVRVGLLSVTAAGVGLTLTAASNVMFAELHYTPGVLCQAEDRAHRIGQRNAVNIMYFICKDETASIDGQIWNMLGRKIGTLEQVIEGGSGKERAALQAEEVEGTKSSYTKRQSAQEELTTFFAETAASDKTGGKNQPKVAVKGSILSFFKKVSDTSTATPSNPQTNGITGKGNFTPTTDHTTKQTANGADDDMVEWACEQCTFINSKKRQSHLACEMCNALYAEEDRHAKEAAPPLVTPKQGSAMARKTKKTPGSDATVATSTVNLNQSPLAQAFGSATLKQFSPADVVVIDDCSPPPKPKPKSIAANKRKKTTEGTTVDHPVVIDLNSDNDEEEEKQPLKKRRAQAQAAASQESREPQKEILLFSVSKNSGRITLHYKQPSSSSFVNFDINDILMEETVEALAEVQTKRSSKVSRAVRLSFRTDVIQNIVKRLDPKHIGSRANRKQARSEIESFVTSFLALREIQRKAIKSAGEPFSSTGLAVAAAKVMTQGFEKNNHQHRQQQSASSSSSSTTTTIERYSGGAKERAQERLDAGTASWEDMGVLKGERCSWCAGILSEASRRAEAVYCSQQCAEEGRIKRGGMFASSRIRDQAFALEAGVCSICGIDAHALFLRVKSVPPPQRLSILCNVNWKLPKTGRALERFLQDPIRECSFWEVDHIKAVAEGGGSCGMENLRTLCVPCHGEETAKLRHRLRLAGRAPGSQGTKSHDSSSIRKVDGDIRTMLGGSAL